MIKRTFFTTIAVMMAVLATFAVPAKPGVKKLVKLVDGTTVELSLCGDEHYSFLRDDDGNSYQLNAEGRAARISNELVTERWTACKQARLAKADGRKVTTRGVGEPAATIGSYRGLVILVQFSDAPFVTENAQQVFNRQFNEIGYKEYGNEGSVKDYFLKQSYGKLNIDFDVVGPYTLPKPLEYYGKPYTDGSGNFHHDRNSIEMVAMAVDAASADVDFRNYDWNKDGEVDQVFVIYSGYSEAQGADENAIWPHEWQLSVEKYSRKYNGVSIDTYACASELSGDGKNEVGVVDGIGTACHEFSHCLGLPDMYDTNGDSYGMTIWDLMDSGSYLNDSRTPAGYTSYERWFAKWLEPIELSTMTRIKGMAPLVEKPEAYVLYNENNRNEYYLLENRQPVSFDKGLFGHGLLILHVDYDKESWETNCLNIVENHQRMTVIAADNEYDARYANTIAGDIWPGLSGNTALTNYTKPVATLYNENVDGRKLMSKPIDNITEDTATHTISFVACRPELSIPDPLTVKEEAEGNAFMVTWPAVKDAIGYEIELTSIRRSATNPEDALQREFDFSKFYSKSAGFSDISSKMADYGLYGWKGSKLFTSPGLLKIGTSSVAGYVETPIWNVPASGNMTIIMGADIMKAGEKVKGTATIKYGNQGDAMSSLASKTVNFEVIEKGKQVLQFTDIRKDLFFINISPASQMYLNYLAIYDGTWNAEQLGISNTAQSRRANAEVITISTETNSYTFRNMSASMRYVFRVRALGEDNTYSQWSEEKSFEPSGTAVETVRTNDRALTRIYDLYGREVKSPQKGIYLRGGRKVVVK